MPYSVDKQHFSDQSQAIAEIEAAGFFPLVFDVPAETNDFHFHDFASMFYVLEGGLTVTDGETGTVCDLRPGDRAVSDAGWVHRETHDGFRAVFGFSVSPDKLTMPINKPLATAA